MDGMIKIWVTPQSYAMITEGKSPLQYWLTKPDSETVELMLPIATVESWKSKVNNKKILFG